MRTVVCFGEVLWDLLPSGRFLGGAPLNVAYHLTQLGRVARLVSAVGNDSLGDEVLAAMTRAGLSTQAVARHPTLRTGTVDVRLDAGGHASYTINRPVAWDEITVQPEPDMRPDAVVFGTLALRSDVNRASLRRWLAAGPGLRVCDLNLRPPFDDLRLLDELIRGVDVLKLNDDEARRLVSEPLRSASVATHAAELAARFECRTVCITQGADGALVRHEAKTYSAPSPKVAVRDTVGAGDAFTAALLDGILSAGASPDWPGILTRACKLGAWVATQDGAQPEYLASEVLR